MDRESRQIKHYQTKGKGQKIDLSCKEMVVGMFCHMS